ncbi:MAG: protein-tyrosine-phosphatase [Flavobacterium sp.]|nr:MAG: protein-tyrosine-phosphatase [Flavobacterium sp.]
MQTEPAPLFPEITKQIEALDLLSIPEDRKTALQPLIDFIQEKVSNKQEIRLNFICTHNSRRSLLSQVWAQALAHHYNLGSVFCYSGGTEATALFPKIAETLSLSGFQIKTLSVNENPVYTIKYADNAHPVIGFSKVMDDDFNPKSEFAAIMTCDSANEACPFVPGAEKRIPITYEDPKVFDNTSQQAEKYKERSLQIATELSYVFSQIRL